MKKIVIALVALLAVLGALVFAALTAIEPPPPLALPARGALLSDVTLVEPGVGRRPGRFVAVEGGHIARVTDARPDPDDPYRGAFVLPGLNDAHVHFPPSAVPGQTPLWSFLFLLHGVTGVRDAGDTDGTATRPALEGIEAGAFPGPVVRSCGPFVDGDSPIWGNSLRATNPEEGRRAVEEIASQGHDCVKAYNGLDEATLDAIREAAHAEALPVIGHVPASVPFERALLDDAQHLIGVRDRSPDEPEYPFNQKFWPDVTDERLDFVIRISLENEIAHTPTLITLERLARMRDYEALLEAPDARMLPRFYRGVIWHPDGGLSPAGAMQEEDFDDVDRALEAKLHAVKRMHDAGVTLHTGTDAMISFVVPGASLHRELRLLVRAGLSPDEALAVSTGATAEILGVPELGLLRPGAPAELVLFREDPTLDLDALDTLLGVVRDGRLYSRDQLEGQLALYREHFEGGLYDAILTPLVSRAVSAAVGD